MRGECAILYALRRFLHTPRTDGALSANICLRMNGQKVL